ncbi:unnamed protein product [Moneuplotes crassus]|uniref:Uncharacterized protein n=1 Tax=Euplotes crassus TaxID=5936 RepID=A0AAD1ULK2_EUPCR|nr:unnamed protein product [Moneuplotes crassus]
MGICISKTCCICKPKRAKVSIDPESKEKVSETKNVIAHSAKEVSVKQVEGVFMNENEEEKSPVKETQEGSFWDLSGLNSFVNHITVLNESKMCFSMNKVLKIYTIGGDTCLEFPHPKQVNYALPISFDETTKSYQKVATCCRDGIVRIFTIPDTDSPFETGSEITLEGHTLSVTSCAADKASKMLATGGRDYQTLLWDLNTNKQIRSSEIERNMVTSMKWIPGTDTFLQASEDLHLRIFDTRDNSSETFDQPLKTNIGDSFAQTLDITQDGYYCVTGHSPNYAVKLWDLRMMEASADILPVFTDEDSEFGVVATHFWENSNNNFIISCSKDGLVKAHNFEGAIQSSHNIEENDCDGQKIPQNIACMVLLPVTSQEYFSKLPKSSLPIITCSSAQKLQLFGLCPKDLKFTVYS